MQISTVPMLDHNRNNVLAKDVAFLAESGVQTSSCVMAKFVQTSWLDWMPSIVGLFQSGVGPMYINF